MAATITLSATSVIENPVAGTVIGTLSATGGIGNETFTYALADNLSERFAIVENGSGGYDLVVKTGGGDLFDFETDSLKSFVLSISATGDKGTTAAATDFTINVTDNTAPTDLTLSNASVAEHAVAGTEIGSLSAIDPDLNETFSFTLLSDAEGRFEIKDGKLVVKDGSKLDFLTAGSHEIKIQVTDSDSNTFEKTLTISVTDAPETLPGGTSKNDKLYGTEGADLINGGAGNDWIFGKGGDDVINGGLGKDFLFGGAGKDTFVFDTPVKKGHFDHIRDFNAADDTIQISLSALKSFKVKVSKEDMGIFKQGDHGHGGKGGSKKSTFSLDKVFKQGKLDSKFFSIDKAKDSNDFVYYNKKNGFVYLDIDGSGKGKGIEIVKLEKGLTLTADDFQFI